MRTLLASSVLIVLLSAAVACGTSPAMEPEIPPPPPRLVPPDAPPPSSPPPGELVLGADADAGVPGATAVAGTSSGPLPDLPSSAPIYAQEASPAAAPPAAQWTYTYPNGRWVYAQGYGWMWIPNEAGQAVVEEVPYTYFYTPSWGWAWYVSPWGFGPYAYGGWVRRPWHPVGWRGGWVAPPHVYHRIGGGYRGWGHGGFRAAPHVAPRGGGHHR